jgi:hypothetical protein
MKKINNRKVEKLIEIIEKHGLITRSRKHTVVYPRYYTFVKLRQYGLGFQQIADIYKMNHSSVIHGISIHKMLTKIGDSIYREYISPVKFEFEGNTDTLEDAVLSAKRLEDFLYIQEKIKLGAYDKTN